MSSSNTNSNNTPTSGNNSNILKSNKNENNPNLLSPKIKNITNSPNNLLNIKTKCNETLKVNFKPPKSNNNKNNPTDNSEGKMACIIS